MAKSRIENPFVHLYAANKDMIVHIRQLMYASDGDQLSPKESQNRVVMTLMQFCSLTLPSLIVGGGVNYQIFNFFPPTSIYYHPPPPNL